MWPFSTYSPSWEEVAQQKQGVRDEAVARAAKTLGRFSEPDEKYVRATAPEIVRQIESGAWTANAVVKAYIRRAIVAQERTNCLTEVLFDQALQEAVELDKEFASSGKLKGPLHGVPVSFKDQFDVTGYDSSIGYTRWANKPSSRDSHLVKQFRAAGALIIAKTNVPQTMLAFECNNPLWGRSLNPYSKEHTPGGSSGGEAALTAMSGSAIGLGSDVGGSLRIPVGYCGGYSLKPGPGRFSVVGMESAAPGFEGLRTTAGPITRSVEEVELVCRYCFGADTPLYGDSVPVPYREVTLAPKLRFGYYTSDLCVKASPACQRAVLETVEALRKAGHECIEFKTSLFKDIFGVFTAVTAADGFKTLLSHLGPDPKDISLFLPTLGPKLPSFLRGTIGWILSDVVKDPFIASSFKRSKISGVGEFYKIVKERDDLTQRFYEEVWDKYGFDAIIAPIQASPAVPHDSTAELSPLAVGTAVYNVVDSPVGVIPVTRVDPALDAVTADWRPGAEGSGSKLLEDALYWKKRPVVYDAEAMKGLPVGVQIVGRRWEEEKVIAMMKVVDGALGERGFGPGATLDMKLE